MPAEGQTLWRTFCAVELPDGVKSRVAEHVRRLRDGPFELSVSGPGSFPPHGPPRVLWLGIEDASGRLAGLQRALEDECAAAGFAREPRPFRPHLTVARIRSPQGARELAAAHRESRFEPQTFTVSELVVMRSELGPGGSRYTPLSHQPLADGGM